MERRTRIFRAKLAPRIKIFPKKRIEKPESAFA